ncbi:MAG: hypothetical protein LUE93_13330 [Bacteroides sp.]|nr:hypothetical protein [Bacteroides sp.]
MSYEIPGLDTLLSTYAENIIRSYQDKTKDIRASGALCNSVTYKVDVQGDNFEVTISLEDYWEYIEYGRAPGKKFPPQDQILEWIRIKRIIPTPYTLPNGKQQIPTENQLAYLISRKIARDGTDPRPYLQESIDENYENFSRQLIDLLGDTVLELIDNNLNL